MCQLTAQEAEDALQALLNLWRENAAPRKQGAKPELPQACHAKAGELFQRWMHQRSVTQFWERCVRRDVVMSSRWFFWRNVHPQRTTLPSSGHVCAAFHGTWMYALWPIMASGCLLGSFSKDRGHGFWMPGVYCSPYLETALSYGRPHMMFGDGIWCRAVLELRVDLEKRSGRHKKGEQWVFQPGNLEIVGLWLKANAPPSAGEERLNTWDPMLEAVPRGWQRPPPVTNARTPYSAPHPVLKICRVLQRCDLGKR